MRLCSCLWSLLAAAYVLPTVACAVEPTTQPSSSPTFESTVPPAPGAPEVPSPPTSFLWGIQEGSPRALGVLRVANRFSQDDFGRLGIAPEVTAAVLAQRPFRNLHALAAAEVALDGEVIRSLVAAAASNGWTDAAFYQQPIREFSNYQLTERADGSLSAFSMEGSIGYFQHDLGTPDQRIVRIPDAKQKVTANTIWREARNTGQFFALTVVDNGVGNQALAVYRLAPGAAQGPTNGQFVTVATFMIGKIDNPSVAMTVDAQGAVNLVYPMTAQYGGTAGIYLTHCSPEGVCARQLVTADTTAVSTVLAAEQFGDEMVIARRVPNLPTLVETYTRRGSAAFVKLSFEAPVAYARRISLHAVANRWVATMSADKRGVVLERSSAQASTWNLVAELPRLPRLPLPRRPTTSLEFSVGDARGLAVRYDDRIYVESDQFAGQALADIAYARLLSTGQVAAIAGSYVVRQDGAPLRFRDPTKGAGSQEFGRDPCYWGTTLPYSVVNGVRTLKVNGALTIAAGTCLDVDLIEGSGTLSLAGTQAEPITVRGAYFTEGVRVVAQWTFFDEAKRRSPLGNNFIPRLYGSPQVTWRHVSLTRPQFRLAATRVDTPADESYRDRDNVPNGSADIQDSYITEVGSDVFVFPPSIDVKIARTEFARIKGTAVRLSNGGLNDTRLSMADVTFYDVGAALRLLSVTPQRRAEIIQYATGLTSDSIALLRQPAQTPIALRNVRVEGTHQGSDAALPAVELQTPVGLVDQLHVERSVGDGVAVVNAGELEFRELRSIDNLRHGLRIEADNPPGLGPCYVPDPRSPFAPRPVVIEYPLDPKITRSEILRNGKNGIWLAGPHIPTQLSESVIANNAFEGLLIANGHGPSAPARDVACPSGWRSDTVDAVLPLSPDTFAHGNNLVQNDVSGAGVQVRSAHLLGTLPLQDNYWGTASLLEATLAARCESSCALDPIRPSAVLP